MSAPLVPTPLLAPTLTLRSEVAHSATPGAVGEVPGVDGAVVLSLRGGDFIYDCGQDLSIGYSRHDDDVVRLYIEESFSFVVASPDAAVALTA